MTDYKAELKALCDPAEFSLETKNKLEKCKAAIQYRQENTVIDHTTHLNAYGGYVLSGDLRIQGDLYIDSPTYILGDLSVEGVIYGGIHTIIMVAGNIGCQGMCLTRSYGLVAGDMHISQYAYFNTYGSLMLYGKLFTKLYINDDTWCNTDTVNYDYQSYVHVTENIHAQWLFNEDGHENIFPVLSKVLKQEAIKMRDERIDLFYPFELIAEQKDIFSC